MQAYLIIEVCMKLNSSKFLETLPVNEGTRDKKLCDKTACANNSDHDAGTNNSVMHMYLLNYRCNKTDTRTFRHNPLE